MAIESGRIVAGPVTQRTEVFNQPVHVASALPGESYRSVDEDGARVTITVSPDYEGQVYFQRVGDAQPYQYSMSVVVDVEGVLTWVPVAIGTFRGGFSGRPFDPMK